MKAAEADHPGERIGVSRERRREVYFVFSKSGLPYGVGAGSWNISASVPVGVPINGPSVSRGRVFVGTGDTMGELLADRAPRGVALGLPVGLQ